jgi:hypothetical protein
LSTALFLISVVLASVSVAASARAQEEPPTRREILLEMRREKAAGLEPYDVPTAEARVLALEKARLPQKIFEKGWRGIRPVLGGMPSGSGFVFGGGYVYGLGAQRFQFEANGRLSTKGYKTADAELIVPPPQEGRRYELRFRGEYRDLTSLRFFGLGNDSLEDDESTFLLNDKTGMAYLWLNPRGLLSFGAQGGVLQARTDRGTDERSIEEVFGPADVPGFADRNTEFAITGGWLEVDLRDKWAEPAVGLVGRVTALRYEDTGLSRYDFTKVAGDIKAYVPLGVRSRILALRLYSSHSMADTGKVVPFYLMETLGGAKDIRGYREFRFRDTRNFLVEAEYRWEIWPYTDMTVFMDAGKVFRDWKDFNFDGMHAGYGFGLRIHAPEEGFVLRMDVGRSVEGFRFHISGGPAF